MAGTEETVEVSVEIAATRETVWRCLVEADLLSRWLAAAATIDPRVGGRVRIDFARYGTEVEGEVLELAPGERLAFTWGVAKGPQAGEMPAGSTRVSIALEPTERGTLVTLRHAGLPTDASRRDHEFGWKGYLGQLAQTGPRVQHDRGFEALVDDYLAAWGETDAARRGALLAGVFAEAGTFVDVHAATTGRAALDAHIAACQRMFPGTRLVRDGAVMQTRGSLLARWTAQTAQGQTVASGVNVFRLAPGGAIEAVEGFWA